MNWFVVFGLACVAAVNGQLQNIIHQPGAPQLFNDIPFGDASLDSQSQRDSIFEKTPKDTLIPPPKVVFGYSEVRRVIDHALETASTVDVVPNEQQLTILLSVISCAAVVFCGVLPALIIPIQSGEALHNVAGNRHLNLLLSFAVGSLLGDVFMHILPETWDKANSDSAQCGLFVILGITLCFAVEKCCASTEESQHRAAAILNLAANLIDNFTHGLAVASSFLISNRFGILTTLAILVHEVPHEISDFAILLRADFDRWSAVKAQLLTSVGGVVGACVAVAINCAALESASVYILSFTAGGFINIALVEILPELLNERDPWESMKHFALIILGVVVMGAVNVLHLV